MNFNISVKGSRANILDLIDLIDKSTLSVKYETNAKTTSLKCPSCKAAACASYRNLEQHLNNKHGQTLDATPELDDSSESASSETAEDVKSAAFALVNALAKANIIDH